MRDVVHVLLGALRVLIFFVDTLVFIPIVLLVSIGDRDGRRAYAVARWWAWLNVALSGVRVEVEGLAHLEPDASYVFMSNHRSAFDVLLLIVALWNYQLRWVAKVELGRIPGFGWCLRATKQIFVDRANHERAVASLEAARDRIRQGVSVVVFPEGHRNSGTMLPFKKGGFVFAIETAAPIVPIGISGSGSLVGRNGLLGRLHDTVGVAVRPPVATAGLTLADRDRLLARVRWVIASAARPARTTPPLSTHGPQTAMARSRAHR